MRVSFAVLMLLGAIVLKDDQVARVQAITEEQGEVTMRDASAARERPRLEGYDMDAEA
jgi:hypothetical protein